MARRPVSLARLPISRLLATALLLATSVAIMQAPGHIPHQAPRDPGDAGEGSAATASSSSPAGTIEAPRRLRKIAPEIVAPPDLSATPLSRLEARPPLGALGNALPLELRPDTWRPRRILRPSAMTAALLHGEGHRIAVRGVRSPDPGLLCQDTMTSRPCADLSREALQAWLAENLLTCNVPRSTRTAVSTTCSSGRQDLGAWLVSNGWALAEEAGPYGKAELVAVKARMGIFAYQLSQ